MKIREIQPEDKNKILKSFKPIFATWDYLPAVIDDWLMPEKGKNTWVLTSDDDETFIILAQSQFLSDRVVYLRGLRSNPAVAPKEVSQGVIKLTQLLRDYFGNTNVKEVKFRTLETFQASKRIAGMYGFNEELRIAHHWHRLDEINQNKLLKSEKDNHECQQIATFDRSAYDYAKTSDFIKLTHGNIFTWWDFREFSEPEFNHYIKSGLAFKVENNGEIKGLLILTHIQKINFMICSVLDCQTDDALKTLFLEAFKKARELNCSILGLVHPDINKLHEIQSKLGLKIAGVHSLQFTHNFQ